MKLMKMNMVRTQSCEIFKAMWTIIKIRHGENKIRIIKIAYLLINNNVLHKTNHQQKCVIQAGKTH